MIDEIERQEGKKSPGSRIGTHLTSNEDTPCSPKMYAHVHRRYQSSLARWFARPRSRIFSGCRLEDEQVAGFSIGDGRDDKDYQNCNEYSDSRVEGDNGNQTMESSVRSSPNMARREGFPRCGKDSWDRISATSVFGPMLPLQTWCKPYEPCRP